MRSIEHNILLGIVFVSVLLFSCGKESSCLKSTGDNTFETRTISKNITQIELEDNVDVVINYSSTASLRVEGGGNLIPYIVTDVDGSNLKIANDNSCNFLRSYDDKVTVHLALPNLKNIKSFGYGNVTSANTLRYTKLSLEMDDAMGSFKLDLDVDEIAIVQHTGAADVTLTGIADKAYLYTHGNGWFFAKDLTAKDAHVNNEGTGDVIVNASNNLLMELYAIGNIDYYGNPISVTVSQHSGSGAIRKK